MALETVVYPQDSFGYGCKELYTMSGSNDWGYEFNLHEDNKAFVEMLDHNGMEQTLHGHNWESNSSSSMLQNMKELDHNSSPEAHTGAHQLLVDGSSMAVVASAPAASGRRKRRRIKCCKNKEELENQRMTHIAVERNRRKQMNEHLAVIRSLMPASYVQRGDQASIIGGAINFVKELEQQHQTLEAQKRTDQQPKNGHHPSLFADFFTFPQYSTHSAHSNSSSSSTSSSSEPTDENRPALADIEVTMAESHANLKILKKRRPKQLLKIVAGLQCLCLTILHLNVTSIDHMVLYSFSVKLEDGCQLTTADEIADTVHHLLGRTQEEAALS